tara:strand:+ start:313 stop:498 length:186 start_codon:yes stop_codon:yes gene_type:complete
MKHHIRLVKGSDTIEKKHLVSLSVGVTDTQLKQMKALSGLKGNVSKDLIVREFIKSKMYGW